MDIDDVAEVRQLAQTAESNARVATDPAMKMQWEALSKAWRERLAFLEAQQPQSSGTLRVGPPPRP